MLVLSLFDYTGLALQPWVEKGYACKAVDILHHTTYEFRGVEYTKCDLRDESVWSRLYSECVGRVKFCMAFPPCTDLTVTGARWWRVKAEENPNFQKDATQLAVKTAMLFTELGAPWFIENPVGALSKLWRSPDYTFHPY